MKILIIGGAGYIGSHVVHECLDAGHQVTIFDNLSTGHRSNVPEQATFIQGDILNKEQIQQAMQDHDTIIHLAALKAAGESMQQPEKYSENNITGTLNILNAAAHANIKYFIFSSSAAVYGEPEYVPVDEKHTTTPENYYGFTKLEIERFLDWYDKLKNIKFVALRYFNAAGYDMKGRVTGLEKNPQNLLPIVMEVAIGQRKELHIFGDDYDTRDGSCVRDYIHVNDLARGHVSALNYLVKQQKSLVCNLGTNEGATVKEIVEKAREITGKPIAANIVDRRPGDPSTVLGSNSLAKEKLDWQAQHDIQDILTSTWQVYKQNL